MLSQVRVLPLKGTHVTIVHMDHQRYDAAIAELLVGCGYPERVTR